MLTEKREEINRLLNQLEISVADNNSIYFIKDSGFPSLVLWSKYQGYLNGVLTLFEPKERQDYRKLATVMTDLKLDEFCFSASDPFEESEKALKNYIKFVKEMVN